MFFELLKFEFFLHSKQRYTLILSLVFIALGFLVSAFGGVPSGIIRNSPYQIGSMTGLFSLALPFVSVFGAVFAAQRDKASGFADIVLSTPFSRNAFFLIRFSGVLLIALFIQTAFLTGFWIGTFMPFLNPEAISPFRFEGYCYAVIVFILCNSLIITGLLFSTSLLTQNRHHTYLAAIIFYLLYFLVINFSGSPIMAQNSEPDSFLAAILDPFGLSAYLNQTSSWSVADRNRNVPEVDGAFLLNRLIWLAVSILSLLASFLQFKKNRTHS